MEARAVTEDNGQPKLDKVTHQPRTESFIAVAFPKGQEQGWWGTDWGAKVVAKAQQDWPGGEWQRHDFAWKIEDGDSTIPNKAGKKNCDREGYPGHWILKGQTGLGIKCYHAGHYDQLEQIQDKRAIKPGDYCRVVFTTKGNGPSQSPGVYINPQLFELSQVGQAIMLEGGPSAADTFGASAPQLPQGAQTMQGGGPGGMPGGAPQGPGGPGGMPGGMPGAPGNAPAGPGGPGGMPGGAPQGPGGPGGMPAGGGGAGGFGAPQGPGGPGGMPAGGNGPGAQPQGYSAPTSQVQQATDFLNPQQPAPNPGYQQPAPQAPAGPSPEDRFSLNGQVWSRAQLHASNWTDQAIDQLPRA